MISNIRQILSHVDVINCMYIECMCSLNVVPPKFRRSSINIILWWIFRRSTMGGYILLCWQSHCSSPHACRHGITLVMQRCWKPLLSYWCFLCRLSCRGSQPSSLSLRYSEGQHAVAVMYYVKVLGLSSLDMYMCSGVVYYSDNVRLPMPLRV